ncbi:DUF4829 domain-containing protein [Clostridium sp. MB40-C1]|uniref:DUF4829 domain-containing protein n=1 Tax=Clostridium sp. MB40-C1 TaxID=3070996 RepID=UPI0027DF1D74|nr:DUF4829 domain-containing protein [Clostridium sp. MB40-C1]WMJ80194.1 DUF4829 domain-containing protein [Clostridium sp. MB40-C1]
MKFKNFIIVAALLGSIIFSVCGATGRLIGNDPDTKAAETVVRNYFKYKNEKNEEKVLSTLTDSFKSPNVVREYDDLESIKLIGIQEEMNNNIKGSYLKDGQGSVNGTTEKNLKVFKVTYRVKYKENNKSAQESGKYIWWFDVIRKDENSPWLIDDFGEL